MRLDALAVAIVFTLTLTLMIHQYYISIFWIKEHKLECWIRAEEILNMLLSGETFEEYVEVRLVSRHGMIQYAVNKLDYEPKAISYTYRLLSNSTLIYCKVYCKG